MDKDFFLNSLQFDHQFSSSIPTWQTFSSIMEVQSSQPHYEPFHSTQPMNSTTTTTDNFESALSSMVSSPSASNPALSNENTMIRELIGKLGNICNTSGNTHGRPPPYIGGGTSSNNSCYSTPLSSPPKMQTMDDLMKENFGTLGNSIALPEMPGDPGFAERAARFSSFGSRSFNGRTSQLREFGCGSNANKLHRVSSSPSLKEGGSLDDNNKNQQGENCGQEQGEMFKSNENCSVSGQNQGGDNGGTRKRKTFASKAKTKVSQSNVKGEQNEEDLIAKRSKIEEKEEENRGDDGKKQENGNQKPPEPPKDYIHVRARRGQATDSHSLAERVRREKISERMKLLQDLVPGCDKVTGKALMLDEIINYVQSLQRQVEFLSMKLANVNPRQEFNMGNLFSKDVIQPNSSMPHPMYPLDSLAGGLYGQPHQNTLQESIPTTAPCPMDPFNHALHLPTIDGFSNGLPLLPSLGEGDLQSIVQMGDKRKMYFNNNLYMGQIRHHQ